MRSVNSVTLLGRVGQDPTVRATGSGNTVASFSLATSFKAKDKDEVTEWHRLVAWGRLAEIVRDYVVKGAPLYVEGRLQTRKYDDAQGVTHWTTEIVVSDMSLLGQRAAGTSKAAALNGGTSDAAYSRSAEISDDDIPF